MKTISCKNGENHPRAEKCTMCKGKNPGCARGPGRPQGDALPLTFLDRKFFQSFYENIAGTGILQNKSILFTSPTLHRNFSLTLRTPGIRGGTVIKKIPKKPTTFEVEVEGCQAWCTQAFPNILQ